MHNKLELCELYYASVVIKKKKLKKKTNIWTIKYYYRYVLEYNLGSLSFF